MNYVCPGELACVCGRRLDLCPSPPRSSHVCKLYRQSEPSEIVFADILSPVVELAHVRLCFGAGLVIPKPIQTRIDICTGRYIVVWLTRVPICIRTCTAIREIPIASIECSASKPTIPAICMDNLILGCIRDCSQGTPFALALCLRIRPRRCIFVALIGSLWDVLPGGFL